MNTESMPLKHDRQQYADHPAAAAAAAPFRTTKTTTRTILVTRALVVVCGVVAAAVAGVTYLSTGVYPRSPVVPHHRDRSPEDVLSLGATSGVLREGSTSTGTNVLDNDNGNHDDETPTQEAFIARYPELMDSSLDDQAVQYQAYLLYSNGMTMDELDAYYHIHDDGQQEGGGGGAGATSAFSCCKDKHMSSGCRINKSQKSCPDYNCWNSRKCYGRTTPDQKYECKFAGQLKYKHCCRTFPDNRVGSKFWVFSACT